MVMAKYPKHIFAISAVLTVAIFLTGVMLGWGLDSYKENDVLNDLQFNELDTQSYFLEQQLLSNYGGDVCEVFESRVGNLRYMMSKIRSKFPADQEESLAPGIDLDYLKRKYFLSEMQFYLLLNDMKRDCGSEYTPIMFFYTKDDSTSERQGYVLDILDRTDENIAVLSFDKDYTDEPLINTLLAHYNISATSTLIIGNSKKEGFVSLAEINELV